eukprot:3456570-Rhodomonas_salina.1
MSAPLSMNLSQSASILASIANIKAVLPCALQHFGQHAHLRVREQRNERAGNTDVLLSVPNGARITGANT